MAHQTDLLGTEDARLPRWIGCRHNALRVPFGSPLYHQRNKRGLKRSATPIIHASNIMKKNSLLAKNVPTNPLIRCIVAALVLELVRSATGQGYFLNSGKRLLASSVD